MKRNAITRIIIWSVVIIVLVGIMGSVVSAKTYQVHHSTGGELLVTEPVATVEADIGTTFEISGQLLETVNVRSSPSEEASAIAVLNPGDAVQIKRYEQADGKKWVFIDAPVQGWILGKYVDLDPKMADASIANGEEDSSGYGAMADGLQEIEIEWVAGSITIEAADVDRVTVKETMASDPKYTMVCRTSGNKLTIQYCEENLLKRGFGLSFGVDFSKNLIIRVPRDFQLDSLEVDTASANMTVKNIVIREVEFDGASGSCNFENCVVDKLDLDTASGNVNFSGTMKQLDFDAASASVLAVLDNVPSRIEMDSMSGDLDLTLPEGAGFTLSMDAMSSDFISDFETTVRNGNYISGDGSCRISMDGMSGDVYIRKTQSAAAAPESPIATDHQHTDECTANPDSCPDNRNGNHDETHHTEP